MISKKTILKVKLLIFPVKEGNQSFWLKKIDIDMSENFFKLKYNEIPKKRARARFMKV